MGRTFLDFNKIWYVARIPAIKTVYTRLTSDLHSSSCTGARKTGARSIRLLLVDHVISYACLADQYSRTVLHCTYRVHVRHQGEVIKEMRYIISYKIIEQSAFVC